MLVCDLTQFYSPVGGGVRRYLQEKRKYLSSTGHHHLLIVPGEKTERREEGYGTIYTIASPLVSRTARYRALLNLTLVEEILEREQPDIIESGDPYQVAWKAIASGRSFGIPTVGFYHSHFPEATIRSVAKYFGGLSVLIASEISQRYVTALYNRFQATLIPNPHLIALLKTWGVENTTLVELGVDTTVFYPDRDRGLLLRKKLGLKDHQKILLYVGRLAPEKNVRLLLEAFAHLHSRAPHEYHLIVVGDGTMRTSLQRLQEKTGAVTWLPYCQAPAELADFYRAASLFIHPGIHETFGLVTLESQACGTPVVGICDNSMERIIFNQEQRGALKNNSLALAEAIMAFEPRAVEQESQRVAAAVAEHYDWKKAFHRLLTIYQEVIDAYE